MNMKEHILLALSEQFERWEDLLASLSEPQLQVPLTPSPWSVKDVITHLWAWQQRSNVRIQAALFDRAPELPVWLPGLEPDAAVATDQINAWLIEQYHQLPWTTVHQYWQHGFLRLLESSQGIAEKDLLDASKYPWLEGHPLAFVLVASYDHHQEHLEKLLATLKEL
jgi:hypothetical protein